MQISLPKISFALLLTITIIMAGGTTLQVVDHLSSDLDYPQFNIKSVEALTLRRQQEQT
jgi:hypothetical protein